MDQPQQQSMQKRMVDEIVRDGQQIPSLLDKQESRSSPSQFKEGETDLLFEWQGGLMRGRLKLRHERTVKKVGGKMRVEGTWTSLCVRVTEVGVVLRGGKRESEKERQGKWRRGF